LRNPLLSRKIIVRTTELTAGQTDAASISVVRSLLSGEFLATLNSDDMPAVMDLFERYMEMTNPVRAGTGTLPRPRTILSGATAVANSGQSTRNVPPEGRNEFPCATSYLDGPRFITLFLVYNR